MNDVCGYPIREGFYLQMYGHGISYVSQNHEGCWVFERWDKKGEKAVIDTARDAPFIKLDNVQSYLDELTQEQAFAKSKLEELANKTDPNSQKPRLMPEVPGSSEEQRYEDGPFKGPWPRKPKPDGHNH